MWIRIGSFFLCFSEVSARFTRFVKGLLFLKKNAGSLKMSKVFESKTDQHLQHGYETIYINRLHYLSSYLTFITF